MKKRVTIGIAFIVILILSAFVIIKNMEYQETKSNLYEQQFLNNINDVENISENELSKHIEIIKDEKKYDLTPLLTVTATCSATIIAIVGGFISSRLINIIDDRNKILNSINNIEDEIRLKKENIEGYKIQVKESYMYEFLLNHLEDFLNNEDLEKIFDIYEIDIKDMEVYWDNTKNLLKIMMDCNLEEKKIFDELKKNNDYNYRNKNLVEAIIEELGYRTNKQDNDFIGLKIPLIKNYKMIPNLEFKSRNEQEEFIEKGMMDISWLEIELENLKKEKENYKNITIEVKGLKIFVISILTIVLNMLMLINPYIYNKYIYVGLCLFNIVLFIIGVAIIINYLIKRLNNENYIKK